jgi:hypothetical protein
MRQRRGHGAPRPEEITAWLGGWDGYELVGVHREPASVTQPVPRIVLALVPVRNHPRNRVNSTPTILGDVGCIITFKLSRRRKRAKPSCSRSAGAPGWAC